ncbi:MAG: nucleotidyltransferase family protein, partial [Clostridiales bacterium]|nr:nucleotidyltransferase family protein [Clostridiales bacterium]
MNKTCGIIAEYNPFHNGHKFHLEAAKRESSAENIVVVMSGNFVQRGEPAIICKFVRARAALLGGADIVLELPINFATASAEGFARGAVYILEKSGIIDALAFGCENNDLGILSEIANFLVNETEDFKAALRANLRQGKSFPVARAAALEQFSQEVLVAPNNILAIEYLKALRKFNSAIVPFGVARKGVGHHGKELVGSFASASALRREILAGNVDSLAAFMPD